MKLQPKYADLILNLLVAVAISLVVNFSYVLLMLVDLNSDNQPRPVGERIVERTDEGVLAVHPDGYGYLVYENGDSVYVPSRRMRWLGIAPGDRTNIQDGVVLHTIYDKAKHPSQTIIGNDVSVGHNAIIHGAVIGDNCLIGMGATLLDNARIPSGCIIAANALVLSNAQLEPNSVYAGVPAKKVKEVTAEQREEIIRRTAHDYMLYASWFKEDE